jgi:hypothetical protein
MKFFDQGSTFRVTASENDVYDFSKTWPCSNLRHGDRVSFTFEKRTGDLVDLQVTHAFAGPVDRGDCESLAAFADDAKAYGLARINS